MLKVAPAKEPLLSVPERRPSLSWSESSSQPDESIRSRQSRQGTTAPVGEACYAGLCGVGCEALPLYFFNVSMALAFAMPIASMRDYVELGPYDEPFGLGESVHAYSAVTAVRKKTWIDVAWMS